MNLNTIHHIAIIASDKEAALHFLGGTQLDKELLDIFVRIPKEELEQCMPKRVDYS